MSGNSGYSNYGQPQSVFGNQGATWNGQGYPTMQPGQGTYAQNMAGGQGSVPNNTNTSAAIGNQLGWYMNTPQNSDPSQYGRWNWAAGTNQTPVAGPPAGNGGLTFPQPGANPIGPPPGQPGVPPPGIPTQSGGYPGHRNPESGPGAWSSPPGSAYVNPQQSGDGPVFGAARANGVGTYGDGTNNPNRYNGPPRSFPGSPAPAAGAGGGLSGYASGLAGPMGSVANPGTSLGGPGGSQGMGNPADWAAMVAGRGGQGGITPVTGNVAAPVVPGGNSLQQPLPWWQQTNNMFSTSNG